MALSILNNIPSLVAENSLDETNDKLQNTLQELASGSRINSGADDAAGLAIANGLEANITALTQSEQNANDGVGQLQVADGSLAQVTTLLNRAITLATESATGTVTDSQRSALDAEFTSIKSEIDSIGQNTTFNGSSVFTNSATSIFISDGATSSTIAVTVGTLSQGGIGTGSSTVSLTNDNLLSATSAATALTDVNNAIAQVAAVRGAEGAAVNRLTAASNILSNQVQNLTSAENGIVAADIGQTVTNLSQYNILSQTGMAALAQANSAQQNVLTLLK